MKSPTPSPAKRTARPNQETGAIGSDAEPANGRFRLLAAVSRHLTASSDPQGMLTALMEHVSAPLALDFCLGYMVESGDKSLRLMAHARAPEVLVQERQFLNVNGTFCGQAAQQQALQVAEQLQKSSRPDLEHVRSEGVRWYACFPLLVRDRVVGTLAFASCQRDRLEPEEIDLLQTLASQVALGVQLRRGEESMADVETAIQKRVAEQIEAYTYSVTHDLRAPLRAIRGFAQALVEDYSTALDESGRDYLKRMDEGAARLDTLIHDLLQYSRLGRAPMSIQPLEVEASLEPALRSLEDVVTASKATINVSRPIPAVLADAALLQQVLTQLIGNALKFVKSSVSPRVDISGTINGNWVRIGVKDNGIGIASAYHQRIFGVFERLHSTDAYPGTGIGLALVSKAMERLGGKVGLESTLGEGSRFWIELPKVP